MHNGVGRNFAEVWYLADVDQVTLTKCNSYIYTARFLQHTAGYAAGYIDLRRQLPIPWIN